MATKALNSLYSLVMPELPYCPAPLIDSIILEITTEFCHETQAWAVNLDAIPVVSGQQDYDLDGEQLSYAVIDTVIEVSLASVTLEPLRDFNISDREKVTLHLIDEPTADDADGLEVQVALRPKSDATIIDARFYDDWRHSFAYGVMGRLMQMPGKAWTNLQLGQQYWRRFWDGVNRAKAQQVKGGTNARVAVKAPKKYQW